MKQVVMDISTAMVMTGFVVIATMWMMVIGG